MVSLNNRIWNAYRESVEAVSREALAKVNLVAAVFDRRLDRPDVVPSPRRRAARSRQTASRQATR
ncbi:MAG: hypothetical protein HYY84_06145 [Deltaproteobacteria bacterium]|nr:hypothetical protein [Deltaproteobacteria bacterium]